MIMPLTKLKTNFGKVIKLNLLTFIFVFLILSIFSEIFVVGKRMLKVLFT